MTVRQWCLAVTLFCAPVTWAGEAAADHAALAESAYRDGQFDASEKHWAAASALLAQSNRPAEQTRAMLRRAAALQWLGQQRSVRRLLDEAHKIALAHDLTASVIRIENARGSMLTLSGDLPGADAQLDGALQRAHRTNDDHAIAEILNNLGNLRLAQARFADALKAYDDSASRAAQLGQPLLAAKVRSNAALAAIATDNAPKARQLTQQALHNLAGVAPSHEKTHLLITLGQSFQQLHTLDQAGPGESFAVAAQLYEQAYEDAAGSDDRRGMTEARGYHGKLLEAHGDGDGALKLTRQAVFIAQEAQLADAPYRWQWQTGRLLRDDDDLSGAVKAYRGAVATLKTVRHDVSAGPGNQVEALTFRQTVGPLLYETSDVLLRSSDRFDDGPQRQKLLREARATVELLKSAELADYFHDQCMHVVRAKQRDIGAVAADTAVIYLIPLADRTEMVVATASGLFREQAPVGADALNAKVHEFRGLLETQGHHKYRKPSRQIYSCLLAPLEALLAREQITTLVFVPDGALRTIPMAALHDGKRFLVERFAIAVSPGLTLAEPKPIERTNVRVLITGLSLEIDPFPPLPYVTTEIDNISAIWLCTLL